MGHGGRPPPSQPRPPALRMQRPELSSVKECLGIVKTPNWNREREGTCPQWHLTQLSSWMRADRKAYPEAGWGGWTAGPLWEPRG